MDINGAACSIELFLGRDSLGLGAGALSPIRWSQWNARAERYQGELDRKDAVGARFLEILKDGDSPRRSRKRLPEMDQLLQAIFATFAPAEEKVERPGRSEQAWRQRRSEIEATNLNGSK